jgi:DIE2/ALG10 family
VPQTQRYCAGEFGVWDPKITTFPGLYLAGTAWAHVLRAGSGLLHVLRLGPNLATVRSISHLDVPKQTWNLISLIS